MADDYLRRTAVTRPILTTGQQQLLDTTINGWQQACNISSQIGWQAGETRKTRLQDLAYDAVQEETRLGSQHAILATHQAAAALQGIEEIEDFDGDYKTSRPEFTAKTVKYDTLTKTVGWSSSPVTVRRFLGRSARSPPACQYANWVRRALYPCPCGCLPSPTPHLS